MLSIIGLVLGEVKNIYALSISRIIIGVAVGFNSALVPLYIREFTPLQLRGSIGSMTQITINIGVLTALVFGLYLSAILAIGDMYL
jgi:MFS family permease